MKAVEIAGQRFGRLVAIKRGARNKFNHTTWVCSCDCGKESTVETQKLRSGHTQSCGCAFTEKIGKVQLRHGGCVGGISSEYTLWRSMIDRCENPGVDAFARYGGRGIKVCERWKDFANFLADMGKKPKGHSLERMNNDGDYEPSNCKWATPSEQSRNKRNNIWITLEDGSKMVLKDFAKLHGIDYHCMYARHVRGQPLVKPR